MKTNRLAVTCGLAAALAASAACSDSPSITEPSARVPDGPSLIVRPANVVLGQYIVCKFGAPGTIRITGSVTTQFLLNDDGINNTADDCEVAATAAPGQSLTVTATELAADQIPGTTLQSVTEVHDALALTPTVGANFVTFSFTIFHGIIVTFTNNPPPPPPSCTFTKGWYRNNGEGTIIAVDGRTIGQVETIFDATPGQPGGVTFGDDNTLLNLYQQLLAALQNLDGNATAGPPAVDVAIAAALAGTGGTGLNITTTLTHEQMSALIDVLSAFNEGEFAGFPHCDD